MRINSSNLDISFDPSGKPNGSDHSNFVAGEDGPFCLESQLLIELHVLLLAEKRYFVALFLPTFILQSLNHHFAQSLSPH